MNKLTQWFICVWIVKDIVKESYQPFIVILLTAIFVTLALYDANKENK